MVKNRLKGEDDTQSEPQVSEDLKTLAGLANRPSEPMLVGWPDEINGYVINDELAWGGQAVALLAYDPRLKRQVVLKYYRSLNEPGYEDVYREGQALARIDNNNVVRCHSVESHEGTPVLVLEHLRGVRLSDYVADRGELQSIMQQLANGLAAIHAAGLIHGDIKPANIVICDDGTAKFIDFGVATSLSNETSPAANREYRAPEVLRGDQSIELNKADMYSLGMVFQSLLDKFSGSNASELSGFQRVADRCAAMDPRDRFDNAVAIKQALIGGDKGGADSRSILIGFGAAAAVLLGAFCWSLYSSEDSSGLRQSKEAVANLLPLGQHDSSDTTEPIGHSQELTGLPPEEEKVANLSQPPAQHDSSRKAADSTTKTWTLNAGDVGTPTTSPDKRIGSGPIGLADPKKIAPFAESKFRVLVGGVTASKQAPELVVKYQDREQELGLDGSQVPVELHVDATAIIISSKTKSFVGVVSFWFNVESQRWVPTALNELVEDRRPVIEVGPTVGRISVPIEMEEAEGKTEFLGVFAASEPWDLDEFEQDLRDTDVRIPRRGVKRGLQFASFIPYVVVPQAAAESQSDKAEAAYEESLTALEANDAVTARDCVKVLRTLAPQIKIDWRRRFASGLADHVERLMTFDVEVRQQLLEAERTLATASNAPEKQSLKLTAAQTTFEEYLGRQDPKSVETRFYLSLLKHMSDRGAARQPNDGLAQMVRAQDRLAVILGAHPVTFNTLRLLAKQCRATLWRVEYAIESAYEDALIALESNHRDVARDKTKELRSLAKLEDAEWRKPFAIRNADYVERLLKFDQPIRQDLLKAERVLSGMSSMSRRPSVKQLTTSRAAFEKHLGPEDSKTLEMNFYSGFCTYMFGEGNVDQQENGLAQMEEAHDQLRTVLGAHPARFIALRLFLTELCITKREPRMLEYAVESNRLATEMYGEASALAASAQVRKGAALHRTGNLAAARKAIDSARSILMEAGEQFDVGAAHKILGQICETQNDLGRAAAEYDKAAELMYDGFDNEATAMAAGAYRRLGEYEKCLDRVRTVRKLKRTYPETRIMTGTVEALAKADLGQIHEAMSTIDSVAKLASETPNPQLVASANAARVQVLLRSGDAHLLEAEQLAESNVDTARKQGPGRLEVADFTRVLAICRELAGKQEIAFHTYEDNHREYMRLAAKHSKSQSAAERYRSVRGLQQNLSGILSTAAAKATPSDLLSFVWDAKSFASRELSETIAFRRTKAGAQLDQELQAVLDRKLRLFDPNSKGEIGRELETLTRSEEDLQRQVADALANQRDQLPNQFDPGELPRDTAIVEVVRIEPILMGTTERRAEAFVAFVLHGGEIDFVRMDPTQTQKAKQALEAWDQITPRFGRGIRPAKPSPDKSVTVSAAPEELLVSLNKSLAPILNAIPRKTHLVISPDGFLHRMPWAVMSTTAGGKSSRLIERHETIEFCESARDYLSAETTEPIPKAARILAVSEVDYAGKETALTHTRREVAGLKQLGFPTTVLSHDEAVRGSIQENIEGQDIIHLATHADVMSLDNEVSKRSPMLGSFVVLSDGGLLYGEEIAQWDLGHVGLTVLSACRGAAGAIEASEGMHGLQRAFKFAGVKYVLANQWQVRDDKAADFMLLFYAALESGKSPSAALRYSQLKLLQEGAELTEWAGWRISR